MHCFKAIDATRAGAATSGMLPGMKVPQKSEVKCSTTNNSSTCKVSDLSKF